MRKPRACSWRPCFWLLALLVAGLTPLGTAQAGPPSRPAGKPAAPPTPRPKAREVPLADRLRSPVEANRALIDKLRSPRETVKTLYFAVLLYDLFPQMIEDALACLDLDSLRPRPSPEDAARLALDLEYLLQSLALPLCNVPDEGAGILRVVLHESDGLSLVLVRCEDGGWRFGAPTLERVPAMCRSVHKNRPPRGAELANLREEYRDPRAAMRQLIVDAARGDFYAAARALDLGTLSIEERRQQGPALAQQLAFVIQHRGFMFRQEIPERPDGPLYTWHADSNGRIALSRVHQADGKDAWVFTRQTVRNIPRMYAAVQGKPADPRYVRLNMVIPALKAGAGAVQKRPEDVPAHLGSPRALLQGFFRTMDGADTNDAKLAEALEYLDLDNVPLADRAALGGKLALKLDAVLRKLAIDLRTVPDDWNAPPQILGEAQGVRVEILRQHDGTWAFSEATVAHVADMFDKVAARVHTEQARGWHLDSARATMMAFQAAARHHDFAQAARCLNLGDIPVGAQDELGAVLAFKLQYVLDRIGGIYVQEIPDNPEGPHYVLYRGELGRIVLDRKPDDPDKGHWLFTPESVRYIEPMFLALRNQPFDAGQNGGAEALAVPRFWDTPGVWLRLRLPAWSQTRLGPLDLYQWLGLLLAMAASWAGARVTMTCVTHLTAWLLRRCGSTLSGGFVASTLRPLTVLTAVWTLFLLLQGLDLHIAVAAPVFAVEKFFLAGLLGWLGLRLIDLSMGIYTNAELLRPHRSLGDMIVPVSMRLSKATVVLVVATYMIYEIGELDLLGRFLTGLGVAGLAASLAAQDAMKSYFGTLLLIGERAFKIGDRISVSGKEGTVEQVGFRSTRLRNADNALITIPNAVVAAAAIDNMGPRSRHSFTTSIVLHPETPLTRLVDFRDRLRAWLVEQQLVAGDKVEVHIQQATVSGVELTVSLFLGSDAPADEVTFREALRCQALALAEALELKAVASPGTLIEKTSPGAGQETPPASQAA